jgi:membrane protease subunit HflC
MSRKLPLILGILVILAGAVLFTAVFTVHQTQQAIVLMLGNPKRVITEPGLQFKIPFVENVLFYDKRVLNLDPPVERVLLSDQKRLLVDAFARYRITDALAFYQAVRTEGGVRQRLGPIINASLRGVLGKLNLASVLSEERNAIMAEIQDQVNDQAGRFGIDLVDVRIRRADLPDEISDQVYQRMRSEREREAAEFRARGFEQAQRIKATADREATVIRAEAKREAEILRGQGEKKRTEVLNDAYGQDQDFFNFYRSMQAYEAALSGDSTYMVLSHDSEFFDFFDAVNSGSEGAGN